MMMLKITAGMLFSILVLITLGFACLGALYFIDSIKEYEDESKYFIDEK